ARCAGANPYVLAIGREVVAKADVPLLVNRDVRIVEILAAGAGDDAVLAQSDGPAVQVGELVVLQAGDGAAARIAAHGVRPVDGAVGPVGSEFARVAGGDRAAARLGRVRRGPIGRHVHSAALDK